jgi:hypothetical protein
MAGSKIIWNCVPVFNRRNIINFPCLDAKAKLFQMIDPATTAPSTRGHEDSYPG